MATAGDERPRDEAGRLDTGQADAGQADADASARARSGAHTGWTDPDGPGVAESLRQVTDAGRAGFDAARDAATALRVLVSADISLARSAFGRTLAFTGVAIAFGASAWLLLMAALIVFLNGSVGWSWSLSLLLCAVISIAATAFAGWRGMRYFEHTRLQATRRQLARLGIGELADYTPEPGSAASTREVTENAPPEDPQGQPVKGSQGIDVTPP